MGMFTVGDESTSPASVAKSEHMHAGIHEDLKQVNIRATHEDDQGVQLRGAMTPARAS
jgi:hypothetical protein